MKGFLHGLKKGGKKMENIVTKCRTIYKQIKKEKGDFYLFMILKKDEITDKWSVVVSAPWFNGRNQKECFEYVARKITKNLSKDEITTIARVGLFLPNEHLIMLVNGAVKIENCDAPVKFENTQMNGFKIHEAYIYESIPQKNEK